MKGPLEGDTTNSRNAGLSAWLAGAGPLPLGVQKGIAMLRQVGHRASSMEGAGRALLWLLLTFPGAEMEVEANASLRVMVMGKNTPFYAMHRGLTARCRPLLPLPLERVSQLCALAEGSSLDDFCRPHFACLGIDEVWLALTVMSLNAAAGYGRAALPRKPTAAQAAALDSVRASIKRVLAPDLCLERSLEGAEKELASRFLTYTGEEVPKMQPLQVKCVLPALPPASHGGSIQTVDLLCLGTRRFLENPLESVLEAPRKGVKLEAKVHIQSGEALELFKLLVERKICHWIEDDHVMRVGGTQILNGMFAVGKGTHLETGEEIQRVIMNLIPCNGVCKQAQGGTQNLPSICQYLSLVLNSDHRLALYQSDMVSAFYLFRLPVQWHPLMAFNIWFDGKDIGLQEGQRFRPCCAVIPMGWSSAVAIMQELAEKLSELGRLPRSHMIRRCAPLPPWLTDVANEAASTGRPWFHVYLDNFCAIEKLGPGEQPEHGFRFHEALEDAWRSVGVLSSEKKKVAGETRANELGACLDGETGTLGPSAERILRLVQSTVAVISKRQLRRKWVQVIAGRWVHCMAFRRPTMSFLDATWGYIAGINRGEAAEARVRSELLNCCCGVQLMHANLTAKLSGMTTASDASSTGGAVGKSLTLTPAGREFAAADLQGHAEGKEIPVLALSLFNGIGCAFRCYDLRGVQPMVCVAYEINKEANRVTSRRWPHVRLEKDVRSLTREVMHEWRYLYPGVREIHLWAGFPCVGLSAVRFGRLNLDDPQSGLFWEVVRILKELKQVFGFNFPVKYALENVASMDVEAEQEISSVLNVKPLKLDSADAVPLHRPRFCWSNVTPTPMEGVTLEEKERWTHVHMPHEFPAVEQWIEEGWHWPGGEQGNLLPTCMKSIKRRSPPLKPAGLDRASEDTILRWQADQFRFPPYQYGDRFVFWKGNKWRLCCASERELLHGLGFGHTTLCWNAGDIKNNWQGYEDTRKSLIGDSFNCFSFVYVAAMLCASWVSVPPYHQLWMRMGLAPGFNCPIAVVAPLERRLVYGSPTVDVDITSLHSCLLRRANHTGSDIRITSGSILNPRAYPRQSVNADWWLWSKVFACRWEKADHINSLELRSLVHAVEWRIRHGKEHHLRIFHLTDSYVAMAIASKGRTSAKLLKPLLRWLTALLLAWDLYLLVLHVESSENPTDGDSLAP